MLKDRMRQLNCEDVKVRSPTELKQMVNDGTFDRQKRYLVSGLLQSAEEGAHGGNKRLIKEVVSSDKNGWALAWRQIE